MVINNLRIVHSPRLELRVSPLLFRRWEYLKYNKNSYLYFFFRLDYYSPSVLMMFLSVSSYPTSLGSPRKPISSTVTEGLLDWKVVSGLTSLFCTEPPVYRTLPFVVFTSRNTSYKKYISSFLCLTILSLVLFSFSPTLYY